MLRAALIVNPAAGRARLLTQRMPALQALLMERGYEMDCVETANAGDSAQELAALAARSASLVLACGGDGTVHGVIQGLAHTGVPLGVVPLGTANALARNLGLPLDPLAAVSRLMTYRAVAIPLGEVANSQQRCFFTVMAGCGPDGALVHSLSQSGRSRMKRHFGRQAYYAHAARLFLSRRWPSFQVEYRRSESSQWETTRAVALMASRVPDLGGLFSGLTRAASITFPSLHLQILHAPAHLSLPAWMLCHRLRLHNPWLTTVEVGEVRCIPLDPRPVYAQADAEPLGALPFTLRIVPAALSLLMPGDAL